MTPVDINVDKNVYLESIYISIIKVKKFFKISFQTLQNFIKDIFGSNIVKIEIFNMLTYNMIIMYFYRYHPITLIVVSLI